MTMNPYLKHYTHGYSQKVTEDLIVQAIKIYGYPVKYLPKTLIKQDNFYKDDPLSIFEDAIDVEVYINSTKGFEGNNEFLSKFRIEVRDQITFTLSRRRFDEIKQETIIMENGWQVLLEDSNIYTMNSNSLLLLEDGSAEGYNLNRSRPEEGDLIYFPLVNNVFEIRFVNSEAQNFYSLGKLMVYELKCELFDYSSERFNTSDTELNRIDSQFNLNILNTQILLENGNEFLTEDGGELTLETFKIEEIDRQAQNDTIETMKDDYEFIVNSERNPFAKVQL